MINAIRNIASNATLANIAQNTSASVGIETTLKSIGRPGFILIDKDIDGDTKQYAAAKEFLYQATCLAVYLAVVVPVFKNGAFKMAKKYLKGAPEFQKFKSANEYLEYHKLAEKIPKNRTASLSKNHSENKFDHDNLRSDLLNNENPEMYPNIKGAIELGNIIGSVLGLAILAPQVSHAFIHPALRFLGLEDKEKKTAAKNAEQQTKIDTKA